MDGVPEKLRGGNMQTWSIRNPELTIGLELPARNESEDATNSTHAMLWNERIDELLAIRQLEDDWDGQGAPAPTIEVVDSALVFALLMRRDGVVPPTGVVQGLNGEVLFDWQSEDGKYIEVEVTAPYTASGWLHVPGEPIKRVQFETSNRGEIAP